MTAPNFKFELCDVVSVAGYEGRTFQVESKRSEYCVYPGEEWTEQIYELVDVHSADWLEADEEDMTLLAPWDQADDYIAQAPRPATQISEMGGLYMYGL